MFLPMLFRYFRYFITNNQGNTREQKSSKALLLKFSMCFDQSSLKFYP